jgi:predicted double-glycine peptidase
MPVTRCLTRCAAVGLGLTASVCGAGCFSPFYRSVDEERLRSTGDYAIVTGLDVPPARGPDGCGAQALAAVLAFADPALSASGLADALPWHTEGATPVDLLLAARDRDFEAKITRGSWEAISEDVGQGVPLLVMVDAAPEIRTLLLRLPMPKLMHWSVVSGVAADGSQVLLAARGRRHHVVGRDDFLKRWSKSANCTIRVTKSPPRPGIRPPPA